MVERGETAGAISEDPGLPELSHLDCGTMQLCRSRYVMTPNTPWHADDKMGARMEALGVKAGDRGFDTGHLWYVRNNMLRWCTWSSPRAEVQPRALAFRGAPHQ